MTELRRRVRAAMLHHGVKREDVKGFLFLSTPTRMKVAQKGGKGAVVPGELDAAIRAFVDANKIDLVILDPIKKAHGCDENDNTEMDAVATILAMLAIEKNIAVDIASHERKAGSPEAGDVNRARGAGSMKDAGRLYLHEHMDDRGRGEDLQRLRARAPLLFRRRPRQGQHRPARRDGAMVQTRQRQTRQRR